MPDARLVTVVVPVYNRAGTVRRCLESILAQSHADCEAVVVDDGSSDGTADAVAEMARLDRRVRLLRHARRRGAQAARNSGIRAARGGWIAFLDSDDYFLPFSVEVRLRRALAEERQVIHSACQAINASGAIEPYHVPPLSGRVYTALLRHEGPLFQALLVRRSALVRIGWLDERISAFQEWETAIRLARRFEFGFEPQPTFVYDRRGSDTMSRDLLRGAIGYEQIVRKHTRAMLWHAGPGILARHYLTAARWYDGGSAPGAARRCRARARAWSCLDPAAALRKLRTTLAPAKVDAC